MQTRWTAIIVALLTWPAGAKAAPLDQAACDGLKTERNALISIGIDNDMARGPDWAKASNLPPERMKQIQRMIEVDEQLSFRCGEAVTARPAMREPPPKPVEAAAVPAEKDAAGQAATLVSPSGDNAAPKKKKPAAEKKKPKSKDSAAAGGPPALSP